MWDCTVIICEYRKHFALTTPEKSEFLKSCKTFKRETLKKNTVKASFSTLAQWMKETLAAAKVDTSIFKAHSSQGVAVTAAVEAGIFLPQILILADWSGPSTFNKFYSPWARVGCQYHSGRENLSDI